MFVYRTSSHTLILLLYVDDIIRTGSTASILHSFNQQFAMKDPVNLHYFLGIQVVRSSSGILLMQQSCILDLFHKFQLQTIKPVRTPTARTTLSLHDGDLLADPPQYRSIVGASQYLTMTQPNIAYSVHAASHFMLMHALRTTRLL